MALPLSRNFSYGPGDPPRSADLNDVQDQIIGIVSGATPLLQLAQDERHISALAGKIVAGTNDATKWGDTLGNWLGATGEVLQIPLAVRQKDRIHSVTARVIEATSNVEMRLWRVNASITTPDRTQVGATQTSVGGVGNPETLTLSGLAEDVGSLLITYYVEFTMTGGGVGGGASQVFGLLYNVSHPQ